MERINFQDGQLVKKGYVTIDGVQYEVIEAEYSGETPVSAYVLNKLQDNIEAETDKIVTTTATTNSNGLMSSNDKTKLDGIAIGANKYVHPSTSGNKHIPTGGSSGQILRWSSAGTAVWGEENNSEYSLATTTNNGLMSSSDKTKLDGIAVGANKYVHPSSHSASMITQDSTHRFITDEDKTQIATNASDIAELETRISNLESRKDILYENETGVTAGSDGASVIFGKTISNYAAVLVMSSKGNEILNTKLNSTNTSGSVSMYWYNNGYAGTFYNNTVYKIIGIGRR